MLLSLFAVLSGVFAAWASPRLRRSSDNMAPLLSSPSGKQPDQRTCLIPQRCCTKIGYPTENDLLPALNAAGVSIPDPNTIVGIGCFPSPVNAPTDFNTTCHPVCCMTDFPRNGEAVSTIGLDCIPAINKDS